MMYNFEKGSQWGKWDLHIHTPESYLNNQFGRDWDIYVKTLFNLAIDNDIKVIGITDYFTIEGYKKIKNEYLSNKEKLEMLFREELKDDSCYIEKIKNICLLPNIEFRLDKIVSSKRDGKQPRRLNYHVILSDELSIDDIEENFLQDLHFTYDGNPIHGFEKRKLKVSNLISLGKKLKEEHKYFEGEKDVFVGCKNAVVDLAEIVETLQKSYIFNDKYLLVCAEDYMNNIDWNGQDHNARKIIVSCSHMIFSSNEVTREIALDDEYEKEFKSKKPCIWGSDAHSYESLFKPDENRYLWIKSEPSFKGLKQLLIEPEDRVFIGDCPNKILELEQNRSYYINKIQVYPNNERYKEKWFDCEIELNSGLVTIIGNRGSGKSAIADIIGLLGGSSKREYFSFLNSKRFNKPPEVIGDKYAGSILWEDGTITNKESLNEKNNSSEVERIKYLPQNYIESVCNELDQSFIKEVNDMVFSYLDSKNKFGKDNFDDLVRYRCKALDEEYENIIKELRETNKEILNYEQMYNKNNLDNILEKLKLKIEEYKNHKKNKPAVVAIPKAREEDVKQISVLDVNIKSLSDELDSINKLGQKNAYRISEIENLISKIEVLEKEVVKINESIKETLENIDFKEEITVKVNVEIKGLEKYKDELTIQNNASREKWHEILMQKEKLLNDKKDLVGKFSEEEKEYNKYIKDLDSWKEIRKNIVGSELIEESFIYLHRKYKNINKKIKKNLVDLNDKRIKLVRDLYKIKVRKVDIYHELYEPVIEYINKFKDVNEFGFEVKIDISSNFSEKLLKNINQSVVSSFKGKIDGEKYVKDLIIKFDFKDEQSTVDFVVKLLKDLTIDSYNDFNKYEKLIMDKDVFNYVTSIDYIDVNYEIKLWDKPMNDLSPGEKGLLLLIFYLVLDKSKIPLVVDQPEDNLDNQSIYEKLVPYIKKAKNNRQVIIVTHNPNLAVACDSEQIIYSTMDKATNKIEYISGSLENENINKKIVDILEGTIKAFNIRDNKYYK